MMRVGKTAWVLLKTQHEHIIDLLRFYLELLELPRQGVWVSYLYMKDDDHHETHRNRNEEYVRCIEETMNKLKEMIK